MQGSDLQKDISGYTRPVSTVGYGLPVITSREVPEQLEIAVFS